MTTEQLEQANKISEQIEKCKLNIKSAEYTQHENVAIRQTYLKVNGIDEDIEVPDTLFRVIGKLILCEYEMKLIELNKELSEL